MAENSRKIMLSGVKPTGRPHIGNYFGAMKQLVDNQANFRGFIMIADYHALIIAQDAQQLRNDIYDLAADYLAIGLDPEKVSIFQQSAITEHTELCWIFNCLTTVPYLQRAHAYKDAMAKGEEINVGLFDYPILMAADILLYDTDVVPVGQDQKQHIEYMRDTAEKFNRIYGETFKLPDGLILSDVGTLPGLDGRKMSKSYGNHIPLFAEPAELKKLVMSIQTDSKGVEEPKDPETCNVFALHKLFSTGELDEIRERYLKGGLGYKESKDILFENMDKYLAPLRERRKEIIADPQKIKDILEIGASKAKEVAERKMAEVRKKIGVIL